MVKKKITQLLLFAFTLILCANTYTIKPLGPIFVDVPYKNLGQNVGLFFELDFTLDKDNYYL